MTEAARTGNGGLQVPRVEEGVAVQRQVLEVELPDRSIQSMHSTRLLSIHVVLAQAAQGADAAGVSDAQLREAGQGAKCCGDRGSRARSGAGGGLVGEGAVHNGESAEAEERGEVREAGGWADSGVACRLRTP